MTNKTAREVLDAATTESDFMDAIVEMAQRTGWLTFHLPDQLYREAVKSGRYDAMKGGEGFPDLVLLHPERFKLAILECKTEKGRTDKRQTRWLHALWHWENKLLLIGAARKLLDRVLWIDVVRPSDWERIETFMKGNGG